MRCKLRTVSRYRSGSVSRSEQLIETAGSRVTVGRGTDSDIFLKDLRVNYRHAEIVLRDFDAIIEAVGESDLRIDGVLVERGLLVPDAEIEVGPYRLQILPDEPDVDLALEVELVTPPPSDSIERLVAPRGVGIGSGLLRKRPLAWGLFAGLLAIGLVLPVLAHRTPATLPPEPEQGMLAGFNRIWISGELASSHRMLADNCEACHQTPFVRVRTEACTACHSRIEHHFDVARFQFAGFEPTRCTTCHTEHQGAKGVVPARQALCADCHADLSEHPGETALLDAADFGTAHPELRPSVITDPATGQIERVALGAPDFPEEQSNLRFPHDIHLAQVCEVPAGGVADLSLKQRQECTVLQMARQRMQTDGLECADCHRPQAGGVNMLPVRMQDHCAVCHRLEFDPNAPGRVLPHGQPDEVIAVVNDFYIARALRGAPLVEPREGGVRVRPGGAAEAPAQQAAAPDPVRQAEQMVAQKLETVFGRSLCGVCHEITRPSESARGEWEVRPVQVAALWMPKARFSHAAHKTTPCTDCHRATTSETSADVLMPAIADCRVCHEGEHARTAIPSTCIMCHVYHRDDLEPMLAHPTQTVADRPRTADALVDPVRQGE